MLAALLILADAAAAASAPMPAFLSGCWEEQGDGGEWTEECWTDPHGGVMIGSGRTGRGDRVSHWEWMRIERDTDGSLTFYGSPRGAPAIAFKATGVDERSATFINADNDYPQRIRYVVGENGLDAEISLADGSRPNRWRYERKPLADE